MTGPARTFYEGYWRGDEGRAAESDPLTPARVRYFTEHVPRGSVVLDAGCGSGLTTALLREGGMAAVGIELSLGALRAALDRAGSAFALAGLDSELPFRDATFDAVYCCEVLEHIYDPRTPVREFHRILRPGGVVVASVPHHGWLKRVAVAALAFDRHFDPVGQHVRFFSPRTLRQLVEAAGFEVMDLRGLGRGWPLYMDTLVAARKRA